jgi:hypothetical protein
MIWNEYIKVPVGNLEIIVEDHYSGKLLRYDDGHNQVQDWARHALSYLTAGRPFSTWGNHGDSIPESDQVNLGITHIKDSTVGAGTDIITVSPWQWNQTTQPIFAGLVQTRNSQGADIWGDPPVPPTNTSTPLYPFYPTKMRFGTGGLDNNQNPLTNISTQATKLNAAQSTTTTFPFVVVDRTNTSVDEHIAVSSSGSIGLTTNRVTFACKLPGGTGINNQGNPYDGYVISEAGLFCDAAIAPTINSVLNYDMRTGLMFAYRTFYGIAKNPSIDITFRWSCNF